MMRQNPMKSKTWPSFKISPRSMCDGKSRPLPSKATTLRVSGELDSAEGGEDAYEFA